MSDARWLCVGLIGGVLASPLARAWTYATPGDGALAILALAGGDVVTIGLQQRAELEWALVRHRAADGSERWRTVLGTAQGGAGASAALALGPDGTIAFGASDGDGVWEGGAVGIVGRLTLETGAPRWQAALPDTAIESVVADYAGDVLIAGAVRAASPPGDLLVLKLAGSDGRELWRAALSGGEPEHDPVTEVARAVAVDPAGDVYVTGGLVSDPAGYPDFLVMKLSGGSGAELWRKEIESGGYGWAISIDAVLDVIAVGQIDGGGWVESFALKLSGSDGAERWRHTWHGTQTAGDIDRWNALALTDQGDAITAGEADGSRFAAARFDGASGAMLWSRASPPIGDTLGGGCCVARSVALDLPDSAYLAGYRFVDMTPRLQVERVSLADGSVIWTRLIDGQSCGERAVALALDNAGGVSIAGWRSALVNGDNCPGTTNPDQLDADLDGLGNACDPFPAAADHELAQCQLSLAQAGTALDACTANAAACQTDLATCLVTPNPDLNGDGAVNLLDLVILARMLAGLHMH